MPVAVAAAVVGTFAAASTRHSGPAVVERLAVAEGTSVADEDILAAQLPAPSAAGMD